MYGRSRCRRVLKAHGCGSGWKVSADLTFLGLASNKVWAVLSACLNRRRLKGTRSEERRVDTQGRRKEIEGIWALLECVEVVSRPACGL